MVNLAIRELVIGRESIRLVIERRGLWQYVLDTQGWGTGAVGGAWVSNPVGGGGSGWLSWIPAWIERLRVVGCVQWLGPA